MDLFGANQGAIVMGVLGRSSIGASKRPRQPSRHRSIATLTAPQPCPLLTPNGLAPGSCWAIEKCCRGISDTYKAWWQDHENSARVMVAFGHSRKNRIRGLWKMASKLAKDSEDGSSPMLATKVVVQKAWLKAKSADPDFDAALSAGPFHVSESMGHSGKSYGIVCDAHVIPGIGLAFVSWIVLHCSLPPALGGTYLINFLRASLFPVGLT